MKYINLIALFLFASCSSALIAQPEYYGNPMENLPPWVTRVTDFGQRADWSAGGKKILSEDQSSKQ